MNSSTLKSLLAAALLVAGGVAAVLLRSDVIASLTAVAATVAGVMAAIGGVLLVWYNGLITPNSAGTSWLINILIIAVLGGMRHPIGPFVGGGNMGIFRTRAAAEAFSKEDPFILEGLITSIVIRDWNDTMLD